MARLKTNVEAPGFSRADMNGTSVSLSGFRGRKNVFLVLNRGFA